MLQSPKVIKELKGKKGRQLVCPPWSSIVGAHLATDEQFLSLYVEFQSCCCGDRERIDSGVKNSLCRPGVRRTVVIWQSLLI